jgi:hypothetical protein
MLVGLEVHMSEEELESLITLDDPGEDELEEDTFHQPQPGKTSTRLPQEGDPTN